MQESAASASNVKPVVATLFGIPAAAIVLAVELIVRESTIGR